MKTADVNFIKWISEAIEHKEGKYPYDLKKELILIIQGNIPAPLENELREKFRKYRNSNFKAIYFASFTQNHKYIYPIKEFFPC